MKHRYIVCINNSTKEQEEKFVNYIKANGLGWWHWVSNVWLIVDNGGKLSAPLIRDELKSIFESEYNLVIELREKSEGWAGFGPKSENKDMFKWLRDNWKKSS